MERIESIATSETPIKLESRVAILEEKVIQLQRKLEYLAAIDDLVSGQDVREVRLASRAENSGSQSPRCYNQQMETLKHVTHRVISRHKNVGARGQVAPYAVSRC